MNGIDIGRALLETRGFTSLADTDLQAGHTLGLTAYDFVGVREYWGSMMACGVVTAGDQDLADVEECAQGFYGFSSSLKVYAGEVGLGTRLGAFGLLIVVTPGPASVEFRRGVRSLKHGSAWNKDYCLTWLIDLTSRDVVRHRGAPLGMYPGRKFFRELLRSDDEVG